MFFGYITRERTCPRCNGSEVYRVRRNGIALRAVCNVFNVRPHWCAECDNFFLAPKQDKAVRIGTRYRISGGAPSAGSGQQAGHLPH